MVGKTLLKVAVALVAIGVLGTLFVRSAMNVSAEPYSMPSDPLARWTVALDPEPVASGVVLALWPPEAMVPPLFSQVFKRSGLSLSGPSPVGIPLILKGEFDRGVASVFTPQSLLALARESSLDVMQPKPLCLASRRISQPGSTRDLFFVRFEHPPFDAFRRQVASRMNGAAFDADAVTPAMIVAATDTGFSSWLPLRGSPTDDCVAPIVNGSAR